ncbi:MAG: hypothetical protein RSG77_25085 [Hafnia sp.]
MLKIRMTMAVSALILLSLTGCASQVQVNEHNKVTFHTVEVEGQSLQLATTSHTDNQKHVTCQQYVKDSSVSAGGNHVSVTLDKYCQSSN